MLEYGKCRAKTIMNTPADFCFLAQSLLFNEKCQIITVFCVKRFALSVNNVPCKVKLLMIPL